jgi:hypothetical protein
MHSCATPLCPIFHFLFSSDILHDTTLVLISRNIDHFAAETISLI